MNLFSVSNNKGGGIVVNFSAVFEIWLYNSKKAWKLQPNNNISIDNLGEIFGEFVVDKLWIVG